LYWYAQSKEFGRAQAFSLFDCIECGACSYVCPSHIPLVQYYRFAKSEIRAREHDKLLADQARERHENREQRIEREKREKAAKLAAKEKAAQAAKLASTPPEQLAEQAELEARREHIREFAQSAVEHQKE
jgi:electron transport complex protein RnfC